MVIKSINREHMGLFCECYWRKKAAHCDWQIREATMLQECRKQEMSVQLPILCQFKGPDDLKSWVRYYQNFTAVCSNRKETFYYSWMDNAPYHPDSLQDKFEKIKTVSLPKNTNSKMQPLNAGIIANWKVHYKRWLQLSYMCRIATSSGSASEIVKSVNLLMAIECGKQAWDEVSDTTTTKCLKKTFWRLYPDSGDTDEDPFEEEELQDLSLLLDRLDISCTSQEYTADEDVCSPW